MHVCIDTEVVRLNALGMNLIVVDTMDAAKELLDKRSATYSDRPRMIMLNELCVPHAFARF